MTGISVAISIISSKNFKHQYLRNKIAYLECASNLEHFEKKDEHPSPVISEIIDSETVGYLNVLKVLLQNTIR